MEWLKEFMKTAAKEESGQGFVEYALIVMLIAIAAVAGLGKVAPPLSNIFNKATNGLENRS